MFQKKAAVWIRLLVDQISLKIIFKIFFVDFGRDFSCSRSMFHSKAPTALYKKMWNSFCSISSRSLSQIFKILFHKLETVIFCPLWCQLLCPTLWNLGHTFVPKLSQKCALNSKIHTHRHLLKLDILTFSFLRKPNQPAFCNRIVNNWFKWRVD